MLGNLLRVKLIAVLILVMLVVGVVVFGATAFVGITGSTSANAEENPCGAPPAVAAGQSAPVGGTAPGLSPLQQQNVLDIPQWWTLDPAWAAEEVEQYGHGGDNYRVNIPIARAVMDSVLAGQDVPELPDESVRAAGAASPVEPSSAPTGASATAATPTCIPAGPGGSLPNTVVANGVSVQIPAGLPATYVAASVAGKTIQAPTAGLAKGL